MVREMTKRESSDGVRTDVNLTHLERAIVLPPEALVWAEILKVEDTCIYLRLGAGLEIWAYMPEQEVMETVVGQRRQIYLMMQTERFEVDTGSEEDETGFLAPVDDSTNSARRYRYRGEIRGFYDWHIQRNYATPEAKLAMYVLADTKPSIAVILELSLSDSRKVYFGYGDRIRGEGSFTASLSGHFRADPRHTALNPPWHRSRADSVHAQMEDVPATAHIPSRNERRQLRKMSRPDASCEDDTSWL